MEKCCGDTGHQIILLFLSFIAYRIHNCEMCCRLEKITQINFNHKKTFQEYFTEHCAVLTMLKNTQETELFKLLIS